MRIEHDELVPARGELRLVVVEGDLTDEEAARLLDGDAVLAGRVVSDHVSANLITNVARTRAAALWVAASTGTFNLPGYIGLGTSAITPTATDTVLAGETYRKACSTLAVYQTYYSRWVANFTTSEVSGTFLGMALFGSSSGGDMHAIVGTSVAKSTAQSLVAEWRWLHSSA